MLEGDLGDEVVECVVVDDVAGPAAPVASGPEMSVETDAVELVDMCVATEVVLVAMTVEDVDGLGT